MWLWCIVHSRDTGGFQGNCHLGQRKRAVSSYPLTCDVCQVLCPLVKTSKQFQNASFQTFYFQETKKEEWNRTCNLLISTKDSANGHVTLLSIEIGGFDCATPAEVPCMFFSRYIWWNIKAVSFLSANQEPEPTHTHLPRYSSLPVMKINVLFFEGNHYPEGRKMST